MPFPKTKKTALWARVLEDRKAKSWLKEHADEFPAASFLPDDTAFKDKVSSHQKFLAEILADITPGLSDRDRRVVELYLRMHPSRMAKELRWPRKKVYLAIRRLKHKALRTWQEKQALLERKEDLHLDTTPSRIALRTVVFRLVEKERRAYLINRDGLNIWVDEAGGAFADDVQEILHELPDIAPTFETIDAESEG